MGSGMKRSREGGIAGEDKQNREKEKQKRFKERENVETKNDKLKQNLLERGKEAVLKGEEWQTKTMKLCAFWSDENEGLAFVAVAR